MTHSHVTPCGLPGVGAVPVGMHSCHFYSDRQQLIDALVPFTLAGLQANERCLIIASAPLPARDLVRELRQSWDGVEEAIHSGALRVLNFDWYFDTLGPEESKTWSSSASESQGAGRRLLGIRVSGNISFLTREQWPAFMAYEKSVSTNFSNRRIVALCSYVLEDCIGDRKDQVLRAHGCAFERRDKHWYVVPAGSFFSGQRKA